MSSRARSFAVLALAAVALLLGTFGWQAAAQIPPILTTTTLLQHDTTTTTTAPSGGGGDDGGILAGATTTTAAPAASPAAPPPAATDPSQGADGGGDPGLLQRVVPAEAQAVIDSIVRTPASNNAILVQGEHALEALGVPPDQAAREAYGRFPLAGAANWSDDWYYPRWTGALFRFHEGCDVFAAYGTPVRAPIDGVVRTATNPLGGLTVSVVQPDGTYFYLAHLSALAPNLVQGMPVATGDIVGYVGDSGNARGGPPHLHLGFYPRGGPAAPPKPILDRFVADAAAQLPALLAAHQANLPRALLTTSIVRRLADLPGAQPAPAGPSRTELLWASSANPAGGSLQLAEVRAAEAAGSIDWTKRAAEQQAAQQALSAAKQRAWAYLAPLTPPALVEALNRGSS